MAKSGSQSATQSPAVVSALAPDEPLFAASVPEES
jgi:hypothetical protein